MQTHVLGHLILLLFNQVYKAYKGISRSNFRSVYSLPFNFNPHLFSHGERGIVREKEREGGERGGEGEGGERINETYSYAQV